MSTQRADSNAEQSVPSATSTLPARDEQPATAWDTVSPESAARAAETDKVGQGATGGAQKKIGKPLKTADTRAKQSRSGLQTMEDDLSAGLVKPPRAKRPRPKKAEEVKSQDEPAGTRKRSVNRKKGSETNAPAQTEFSTDEIPAITPAAIEFLGKQNAAVNDLLNLDAESFAFVRHHNGLMQRLEAASLPADPVMVANRSSTGPGARRPVEASLIRSMRNLAQAGVHAAVEVSEPKMHMQKNDSTLSYGYRAGIAPISAQVVIQFRKLNLAAARIAELARASDFTARDQTRKHVEIGTGTSVSAPTNWFVTRNAADRVRGSVLPLGWSAVGSLENSIEREAVRLTPNRMPGSNPPQESAGRPALGEAYSPESARQRDPVSPDLAPDSSMFRRFFFTRRGWANRLGNRFAMQGRDSPESPATVRASSSRPEAKTLANADNMAIMPESVARRYLKVDAEYYFLDRTPAFSDRGDRLATRGADPDVVRSLVEIAVARGWGAITVRGTDAFRRSTWIEATQSGMIVAGYKPTALDLADLANRPVKNVVKRGADLDKRIAQERSANQLPAAQAASSPSAGPGKAAKERANGASGPDPELVAKVKAFQEERPVFVVKKYPDLAAAYGIIAAAKAFATERLPETAREEFVKIAQRHVVEKIAAGEQIQGPRIYLAPTKVGDAGEMVKPDGEMHDRGKAPREKAAEKER